MKIAMLQMTPDGMNQEKNLAKAVTFCKRAADEGADLALLPEMWNIGYTDFAADDLDARDRLESAAISIFSPYVSTLSKLAAQERIAIGAAYLEAHASGPRNTVSLIDMTGKVVLTYAKVHTCDFSPLEAICVPGDGFHVAELETAEGPVNMGAMICYDREHPESARILMLRGAEIIIVPNACGFDEVRNAQLRTRAFENAVGIAMTNYAAPKCDGHSQAYNASADLLAMADESEGIFYADFDLEEIRKKQSQTIWGNAYRRPHRYDMLTSQRVQNKFARKNAFGEPFDRLER